MKTTTGRKLALALVPLLAGLSLSGTASASSGTSGTGVPARSLPGNFVASDDQQVCFELERQGLIADVTQDMRGFKIDPPTNFDNGLVEVTLSADGRYLDWTVKGGAEMVAVIVKGGPNFHLYDYVTSPRASDTRLHSPAHKGKVPQISHYNVCYLPPGSAGGQGCTPGYWRNHTDRWAGVQPSDDFDTTFGVAAFDPDITLGAAIQLNGGGVNALARHATAALLNAHGGVPNADGTTVNFDLTPAQVIGMVQSALAADGDLETAKDTLAALNELGCPLSGTRAT